MISIDLSSLENVVFDGNIVEVLKLNDNIIYKKCQLIFLNNAFFDKNIYF